MRHRELLIGENVNNLLPPAEAGEVMAALREAHAKGASYGKLMPLALPDGQRWLELSVSRKAGNDADPRFVILSRDISERALAQNTLLQREREFRNLAENLPYNIVRWDAIGRFLYVNPSLERTLGTPATGMLGKTLAEVFPDGRFAAMETAVAQVVASGEATLTVRQIMPDGGGGGDVHEISLVPERDGAGQVVGVLGIGRDVSALLAMR